MTRDIHERTRLLLGDKKLNMLATSHVLVAGLGGVGSFAAEAVARVGVGNITLLDHDQVDPSNINRQLVALHSTTGLDKAEVMANRIQDINPEIELTQRKDFLKPENMTEILGSQPFNFVLDCIDSITSKAALVFACQQQKIPIISAMGAGGRTDVRKVQISKLGKTHTCPLAREMRRHVKSFNGNLNTPVVFSTEIPVKGTPHKPVGKNGEGRPRSVNGTISYLPGLFGLMMAGYMIENLVNN